MKKNSLLDSLKSTFAAIVIPLEVLLSFVIYKLILGNPNNFQGGDPNNHPLPGNYLGIVYKGGIIVPLLISLLLMVLTFGIERLLIIAKAKGNISSIFQRYHTTFPTNLTVNSS